jgi:hypothetical protein
VVRTVLIPALRHHVENPVNPQELFAAACEGGVSVKYLTGLIFEKDAVAGKVFDFGRPFRYSAEVVERPTRGDVAASERDVEIVIEIRVVGRDKGKFPPPSVSA